MSLWEPLTGRTMIRRGFQTPDEEAVLPITKIMRQIRILRPSRQTGFQSKVYIRCKASAMTREKSKIRAKIITNTLLRFHIIVIV